MSSKKQKTFDAVQLMRSIRDELFRETEGMSVADELDSLHSAKFADPTLNRLALRAAQQRATAAGAWRRR